MTVQLSFTDQPALARALDPETSRQAAQSVDVERLQSEILYFLAARNNLGATASELAQLIGVPRDSISPRLKPLESLGRIARSGTRKQLSGRSQTVWHLAK